MSAEGETGSESEWVIYYSEEGYPYYYNHSTGESKWVETSNSDVIGHDDIDVSFSKSNNIPEYSDVDESGDEDSGDSDSSEDESNDDAESDESEGKLRISRELESKFKAFLSTEEGKKAVEVFFFSPENLILLRSYFFKNLYEG